MIWALSSSAAHSPSPRLAISYPGSSFPLTPTSSPPATQMRLSLACLQWGGALWAAFVFFPDLTLLAHQTSDLKGAVFIGH